MLAYYIDGIRKAFDYKSTANRKDLNLYILNYILLSVGISLFFGIIYLVVGLNDFWSIISSDNAFLMRFL